ncbi:putative endo-1,4-beta-xylanase [Amylocarpus encephaloides]|uniref:Beta-xylanase n=1 Tax=Amylocarpus encephaloides TaxID=45428 RepID=A0A9P7YPK1_9HELO|nr:putative endo-1,4-beta-xylanase [Amylocarpus encephaloides]
MRFSLLSLAVLPLASAQLNKLAVKAGLKYFGTASDVVSVKALDATYASILSDRKEFGQLTAANGQKWFAVEPEQNVFNYTYGEELTRYARRNKQLLRCHNLVWHSQLAPWVETTNTTAWTKESLTKAMVNHVTHEARHWRGQCYAWDVVNEALNDDGTFRDSIFLRVIGEEYIAIAFKAAHAADPHAKLYYNDYNLESPSPKVTAVTEKIIKPLLKARVPIHGIGMQAHLVWNRAPTLDNMIAAIDSYAVHGLEVAITELDVRIDLPESDVKMQIQKEVFANATGACVQRKACVGLTVWDFWDPVSWVPGVFEGQGAATLYYANFTKHPAYDGIMGALKNGTKDKWHHHHY